MKKVNGAPIQWRAYEFGVKYKDEKTGTEFTSRCISQDEAMRNAAKLNGTVIFKGLYETDWMDAL